MAFSVSRGKQTVMAFISHIFRLQSSFCCVQKGMKIYWVSQHTLSIFTFIISSSAAPKGKDFPEITKISLLSKIQKFKNWVYLYQPNSMMETTLCIPAEIFIIFSLFASLKALAWPSESTKNFLQIQRHIYSNWIQKNHHTATILLQSEKFLLVSVQNTLL